MSHFDRGFRLQAGQRERRALDAIRLDFQQRAEKPHCFECFAPTVVRWDALRGYATTTCEKGEGCRSWPTTDPGPFVLRLYNVMLRDDRHDDDTDETETLCEVCRQPVELDDAEEIEGMPGRGTVWVHDECCEPRWRVHGMATGLPVNIYKRENS